MAIRPDGNPAAAEDVLQPEYLPYVQVDIARNLA
jgi:hypothetical protein